MKEEPSYYSIIPADVRYCDLLPAGAKLLYSEITALCDKKGYCWATNNHFAKLYKKNKATISVWISALENNDFIKCKLKNNNMRRIYIKVGIRKTLRGSKKNLKGALEKSKGLYSSKDSIKKKNTDAGQAHDSLFSLKDKKTFEYICTIKLIKLLQIKNKIMRKPNIQQWTSQFRILHIKENVKKSKIKEVLKWYFIYIGEKYVPDARSAKAFRIKFDDIIAAMNRFNKQVENGEQKIIYTEKRR